MLKKRSTKVQMRFYFTTKAAKKKKNLRKQNENFRDSTLKQIKTFQPI